MFHAPAEVPRVGGGSTRRQCSTVRFADEDCNQQLNPRIFAKLIPRFKGASGAGGLLLNTKASQEAACSRAPDAIVPDQEPESHLEAADVAEGHAGQVDGPGSSGNAGIGSHLAVAPVTDAAWVQIGVSGSSGNAGTGSHLAEVDAAESHAGQVERSGMSGNAGIGSHLVGADFSDEPGWFCDGGPHRAVQNQDSCCTGRPH